MTPPLEQRFRKAYPSVCQIVLRRLVEWKWGRMCLHYTFCAGLAYPPRCCSFAGFRCISCNLYAFWPICRVSAVLTIDGICLTIDDKWGLFYYPNFRGFTSDQVTGKGQRAKDHRGKIGAFLIAYTFAAFLAESLFWAVWVWWDCPVFFPLFVFSDPSQTLAHKKSPKLGAFFAVAWLFSCGRYTVQLCLTIDSRLCLVPRLGGYSWPLRTLFLKFALRRILFRSRQSACYKCLFR